MKNRFVSKKLKYFVKDIVDNRGRNPSKYFVKEKYPVIDNFLIENKIYPDLKKVSRYLDEDLFNNFLRKYLNKHDILMTLVGNGFGSVALAPSDEVTIIQNTIGIQTKGNLDSIYLYYYFVDKQKFLKNLDRGSSQPSLNLRDLLNLDLIVHRDTIEQKKISKVLFDIDKLIERNKEICDELEIFLKTIYDYWFVQFDFPNENGSPYKTNAGKMVWNKVLKRDIPDGFTVERVNKRVNIGSGYPFDSKDYCDDGKYKIVTIKNVQDGYLDDSTIDKIDYIPNNIPEFCRLEIGDILVTLTGNVGRMCFVDQKNLLLNQRVGKLLGEKSFIFFTYLFFQRPENQERLERIASGSSQSNLSPIDAVKDFIVIPPQEIFNKFIKYISPVFNLIIQNKQRSYELRELRDLLLPMLMSDQIRVTD